MATPAPALPTEKKQKRSKLPWIAGILLLIAANAGFWFYRTRTEDRKVPEKQSIASRDAPAENVALDPFVVNLADGGYLKVSITLAVRPEDEGAKQEQASGAAARSALVRDTILSALSTEDAGPLLTLQGKEALKQKLRSALAASAPAVTVAHIYFTEFLVQP